jgi:hypothetical protein
MTAETAPQPEWQVRAQDTIQQGIVYYILAAAGARALRDRRFHATVIAGAIGAVALADLIKNNQARPVRRTISWYTKLSASQELARAHPRTRQELARASRALERGKHS